MFDIFEVFKYILIGIGCILAFVVLMVVIFFIVSLAKGQRPPKRKSKSTNKKRPLIVRLFWDFPQAWVRDFFARNPDSMNIHGIYVFCGAQGSGKTIAAVEFIRRVLRQFPLIKIRSNIELAFQHGKITNWQEIVNVHNGEIGQIDFLDEIQNWFSSNESKDFPPEMLQEITQERKKHKVIVGTSQVFTRMAKPLREQTTYLCLPTTFFGCLTVVRVYKPELDDTGKMISKKFVRMYCFVHDDDLRQSYNTWERVERLTMKGFKSAVERSAMYGEVVRTDK